MSRLNKAEQIIELAMMFQNSYCGLTIDDIADELRDGKKGINGIGANGKMYRIIK